MKIISRKGDFLFLLFQFNQTFLIEEIDVTNLLYESKKTIISIKIVNIIRVI